MTGCFYFYFFTLEEVGKINALFDNGLKITTLSQSMEIFH